MQGRAVVAEQPAELGERLEVAAVGESRDAAGTPGPGSYQSVLGGIDGGERPVGMAAGRAGVPAQGEDGGRDHLSGRGHDVHMVRLRDAGRLGGYVQCLVPAPGVDVCPPERGQARGAGAPHPGCPEPLHGILQHMDRQVGFVQEPCGGPGSPQSRLVKGRARDTAQVRDELVSAAERVRTGPYPELPSADINARATAGRWPLVFQEFEDAVHGLAAGGRT